jgi:hypothetical protein
MVERFPQSENAAFPMLVTVSGMVTETKALHL